MARSRQGKDRGKNDRLEPRFLAGHDRARSLKVTTDADGRFRLTGIGRNRLATLQLDGPTIVSQYLNILTRPGRGH